MKKRGYIILSILFLLAIGLVSLSLASASPLLGSGAPTVVSYQGFVRDHDLPFTGTGYFKFAIVKATGDVTYWSNDGTSSGGGEPSSGVALTVTDGLFNVLLGDTGLSHMVELPASAFSGTERYLRIWFSPDDVSYTLLAPDQRIAAVPYALQAEEALYASDADTVDGFHAAQLKTHYQNLVIVAKSGGDFTTVQAALDSITDASPTNTYLVWVAPGLYNESVTMKSYVHLQGAGQVSTVITSSASNASYPPTQATLICAGSTSLRDLTIENTGVGDRNVAILASGGISQILVSDVNVRSVGSGTHNYTIVTRGSSTDVLIQDVTSLAENAIESNIALFNDLAGVSLQGGSFTGQGGTDALGIQSCWVGASLQADAVTVLGENSSGGNIGLLNCEGAAATLRGGSYIGGGGTYAYGIYNIFSGSVIEAKSVTAIGQNSSDDNYGLYNDGAEAILVGGSFRGEGGCSTRGISNIGSEANLEAVSVLAAGELGSDYNSGLTNWSGAEAALEGGVFSGLGGSYSNGIQNFGTGSGLEAVGVTALGEGGSSQNTGLDTGNGGLAVLTGSSFTGDGGDTSYGIKNHGAAAVLQAVGVTSLGDNGATLSAGMHQENGAAAILRGGSFTGAGFYTFGVYSGGSSTLDVTGATLAGEGSITHYSISLDGGIVGIGTSQLIGSPFRTGGTLTCFQVYDGSYNPLTCP